MSDPSVREVAHAMDAAGYSTSTARRTHPPASRASAVAIAMDDAGALAAASTSDTDKLGGYVWYVIALLALVNVFNYMDRMAMSVLLPLIKKDLQLSDGQLGLLVGFAFAVFYAICGIPIARWA